MSGRFAERAATVAAVAAAHADEVDRDGRAPLEAVAALREQGLLGMAVPERLGGEGASLFELSEVATTVGAACASTGMLFAMHQGQAATLWRHPGGAGAARILAELVERQLLLASATTERGIGGDARRSACAIERPAPGRIRIEKDAPVISYAELADAILVTARAEPGAPESDQRLVVCPADSLELARTAEWDALGLRGTASNGYLLRAEVDDDLVLGDDYATVSAHTALPVSHVLWASVWLGIAATAADQARATVRRQARGHIGEPPPGQLRLAELLVSLQAFADSVRYAAERVDRAGDDPAVLGSIGFALAMNAVKISAADAVLDIVSRALRIVGIAGYRLDSPQSLSRQLRDAHGAAIQISNDRLLGNSAPLALLTRVAL